MNRQIKLSKLQKFILSEALERWHRHEKWAQELEAKKERRLTVKKDPAELEVLYSGGKHGTRYISLGLDPRNFEHTSHRDILIGYFGFFTRGTANGYSEVIERKRIGKKEYNRAAASASRAIKRLEARGLLERVGRTRNLQLTATGIATAQNL